MSHSPRHPFLLTLLASAFLASCGGDGAGGNKSMNNMSIEEDDIGLYRAILRPLNGAETSGTMTVRLAGDEIVVEGAIASAPEGQRHYQFITNGSQCPETGADSNADGIVDTAEGESMFGKSLIPLDSNINSQFEGSDFGPIANPAGAIVYRRTGPVSALLSDLRDTDGDPKDHLAKLGGSGRLVLVGKPVVIYGARGPVPESVALLPDRSATESVPIACGILERLAGEEELVDLPEVEEN